jgi:hypothetical protein
VDLETNLSAQRERIVAFAAGSLRMHLKRLAVRAALFALALLAGWAFARLVRAAYDSYEPLKAMLASIGETLHRIGEAVSPIFR